MTGRAMCASWKTGSNAPSSCAEGPTLSAADLDLVSAEDNGKSLNLRAVREEADQRTIRRVLSITDGNMTQAAKMLGVSRPTLYDLMRQHNIKE